MAREKRGVPPASVAEKEIAERLATGEHAWIARFGQRWKVLRRKEGVQGNWEGDYASLDEARAGLDCARQARVSRAEHGDERRSPRRRASGSR